MPRRFPTPWTPVEIPAGYRIDDAQSRPTGIYVYGTDDGGAEAISSGRLTREEARRMAAWVCKVAAREAKGR